MARHLRAGSEGSSHPHEHRFPLGVALDRPLPAGHCRSVIECWLVACDTYIIAISFHLAGNLLIFRSSLNFASTLFAFFALNVYCLLLVAIHIFVEKIQLCQLIALPALRVSRRICVVGSTCIMPIPIVTPV